MSAALMTMMFLPDIMTRQILDTGFDTFHAIVQGAAGSSVISETPEGLAMTFSMLSSAHVVLLRTDGTTKKKKKAGADMLRITSDETLVDRKRSVILELSSDAASFSSFHTFSIETAVCAAVLAHRARPSTSLADFARRMFDQLCLTATSVRGPNEA